MMGRILHLREGYGHSIFGAIGIDKATVTTQKHVNQILLLGKFQEVGV